MSQLINLTEENICNEHICCAISDKKCAKGYELKKEWLKTQFEKGYRFQKVDVRGKVFIEYIPIEESWLPFDGQNFMVINCFWVSGQFKGQGYGKQLLEQCFKDAVAMDGVIAITGDKKRGFMSDPTFFKHMGFEIIDEAPPFLSYGESDSIKMLITLNLKKLPEKVLVQIRKGLQLTILIRARLLTITLVRSFRNTLRKQIHLFKSLKLIVKKRGIRCLFHGLSAVFFIKVS